MAQLTLFGTKQLNLRRYHQSNLPLRLLLRLRNDENGLHVKELLRDAVRRLTGRRRRFWYCHRFNSKLLLLFGHFTRGGF